MDTLTLGRSYWVKVNQSGRLVLSVGSSALPSSRITIASTAELPPRLAYGAGGNPSDLLTEAYGLDQNYPNPFNPSTVIRYALPLGGLVRLVVYDVLGREVARLDDEVQAPGFKSVAWSADGLPSGVYYDRFQYLDEAFVGRITDVLGETQVTLTDNAERWLRL